MPQKLLVEGNLCSYKNMSIKQRRNRKAKEFAMALRA